MEEESALLGDNGMGESKEDKRMRAKWESLSGAEKSEFKKNYAMRRGITIDFIRRWAWNEGDLDNLEYHIAERRKKFREF
ncbi:hypothetical protein OKX59_03950 [Lactobacillus delbrueckii subsp. indicus]|uniref:hypothetical protein n=1 Tax=Lactobacillus delbrueckii TaxID=1584 RepID=UPI002223B94E|nr:hypothetical protein [Lactobacillus delbrueckii]UYX13525.1 hypothetical protein OJ966_03950 [Lactobacillus delbrueckii]UYY85337.1 hypothetical protein OKX59_03950 [Lactobacillus delbrueckii subsp. indicus]